MQDHFIKSTLFFQHLLSSYFQRITSQVVETLLVLSVCHLFGLYNPNQVADALKLPKARLYRRIGSLSLYHAKSLNLRLGCAMSLDFIKDAESKSASTRSRRCITISVDDTNLPRDGENTILLFKLLLDKTQDFYLVSERLRPHAEDWRACAALRHAPCL